MIGDEDGGTTPKPGTNPEVAALRSESDPAHASAFEGAAPDTPAPLEPGSPFAAAAGVETPGPDRRADESIESASVLADRIGRPRDEDREAVAPSSPRAGLLPGILGVAVLILLGALAYLFSTMPDASRLASLDKSVADLRAQVAALESRPAPSLPDLTPLTQRLDALDKEVAAVQTRPEPTPAAAAAVDLGPFEAKLTEAEHGLDVLRGTVDQSKQAGAALDSRLAALDAKVDAIPRIDLGPLTSRIEGIDSRLKPIETEAQAAKNADRVTVARQNGSAAETRAAPLAVTAQVVLRAVEAGRPFAEDLAVLQNLGAKPDALQPLAAVAQAGAPSTKDLRADLATVRGQIANQNAPTPTGSYVDRLMAGAAGLVKVRPLGSVVGDQPAAVLARTDDDLVKDDLAAALAELQTLPESSRTLAKGLADRIRLRQAAADSARAIGAEAIKAMASAQP